ncbi:hypothetical protein OXX69_001182 [Metschnikowia pulcherrima]
MRHFAIMNSIKLAAFIATVVASFTVSGISPGHTIRLFEKSPPVLSLIEQNRYLSMPEKYTDMKEGTDRIEIFVPPPKETYVWKVTGFYKAEWTGQHTFSIDEDAKLAVFQMGPKHAGSDAFGAFGEANLDDAEILSNRLISRNLEKGEYYPISISYISWAMKAPVYITTLDGFRWELNRDIQQISPESAGIPLSGTNSNAQFIEKGFHYHVFLMPEGKDHSHVLGDISNMQAIKTGFLDVPGATLELEMARSPHIIEMSGHLRPPMDGEYGIEIRGPMVAGLQVGPGTPEKTIAYVIDEKWRVIDNRISEGEDFSLESRFYYPFRLVLFGENKGLRRDVAVIDPMGDEVDLFGLWNSSTPTITLGFTAPKPKNETIDLEDSTVIEGPENLKSLLPDAERLAGELLHETVLPLSDESSPILEELDANLDENPLVTIPSSSFIEDSRPPVSLRNGESHIVFSEKKPNLELASPKIRKGHTSPKSPESLEETLLETVDAPYESQQNSLNKTVAGKDRPDMEVPEQISHKDITTSNVPENLVVPGFSFKNHPMPANPEPDLSVAKLLRSNQATHIPSVMNASDSVEDASQAKEGSKVSPRLDLVSQNEDSLKVLDKPAILSERVGFPMADSAEVFSTMSERENPTKFPQMNPNLNSAAVAKSVSEILPLPDAPPDSLPFDMKSEMEGSEVPAENVPETSKSHFLAENPFELEAQNDEPIDEYSYGSASVNMQFGTYPDNVECSHGEKCHSSKPKKQHNLALSSFGRDFQSIPAIRGSRQQSGADSTVPKYPMNYFDDISDGFSQDDFSNDLQNDFQDDFENYFSNDLQDDFRDDFRGDFRSDFPDDFSNDFRDDFPEDVPSGRFKNFGESDDSGLSSQSDPEQFKLKTPLSYADINTEKFPGEEEEDDFRIPTSEFFPLELENYRDGFENLDGSRTQGSFMEDDDDEDDDDEKLDMHDLSEMGFGSSAITSPPTSNRDLFPSSAAGPRSKSPEVFGVQERILDGEEGMNRYSAGGSKRDLRSLLKMGFIVLWCVFG